MDNWLNYTHGLELYPDINKGRRHNENGVVFFVQCLVLKKHLNLLTAKDKQDFITVVENLRTRDKNNKIIKGLFNRGQGEGLNRIEPQTRIISHDNLTGIVVGSKLFNLNYHNEIASYGLRHFWLFDNGQPESPRLIYTKLSNGKKDTTWKMHPRDWGFWLFSSDNALHKALSLFALPIFFISQIVACFTAKKNTSGKMLLWMRLLTRKELPLLITWKICDWILSKKYGKDWIKEISKIYFWQREDNPIRELTRKL